jgi:hypothetical protein
MNLRALPERKKLSRREVRLDSNRFAEVLNRQIELLVPGVCDSAVIISGHKLTIDLDSFSEVPDSALPRCTSSVDFFSMDRAPENSLMAER